MPEHRILRIFNPAGRIESATRRLSSDAVRHFSEYDAIIVEPTWAAMFGGDAQEAGTRVKDPYESWAGRKPIDYVGWYTRELEQRAEELPAFFRLGGILVVRVSENITLLAPGHLSGEVSAQSWFDYILVRGLLDSGVLEVIADRRITFPGSGSVATVDPGHTFEPYLRAGGGYECRLHPAFNRVPQATILAENRAGDPVALEFEVLEGAIVLVPPPKTAEHEKLLEAAVVRAIEQRMNAQDFTTLDAERDALRAREAALAEQRRIRLEADVTLTRIRTVKAEVLGEEIVRRAVDYLLSATRLSATPERALGRLYKMWEMLEEYCGGSERQLADALRMPLDRIKRIKRLANDPRLDLRHSTAATKEPAATNDVAEAIEIAQDMVRRFVELRYAARTLGSGDG